MPSASSFLDEPESASSFLDESDYEQIPPPQRPITGATGTWEEAGDKPDWAAIEAEYNRRTYGPPSEPDLTLGQTIKQGLSEGMETAAQSPIGLPARAMSFVPRPTAQETQDVFDLISNPLNPGAPSRPPSEAAQALTGAVNVGREVGEGLVSPIGVATLGMGAAPQAIRRLGEATFAADMLSQVPEQARRAGEASVTGDTQERVEAFGGLGATGVFAAGMGTAALRPTRPPELPRPTVAALERGAEAGLSKSVAAAADVVVKEPPKPVAEPAAAQEAALLTPPKGERLVTIEKPDGTTEQASFGDKYWEMEDQKLPSVARWIGDGWSHGLLREGERLVEAKPANTQNVITKETVPERVVVQAEQVLENGETVPGYVTIQSKGNAQSGPVEAWRAAGHEIPDVAGVPTGTYTVEQLRANEKARTQTQPVPEGQAPVVEQGVGAVPENVPASAFFERESEVAGLGRSSLPPGVEDVRAQRARDAATLNTIKTTPLDPASGAPIAPPAKPPSPPTAGAPTAPEIPAGQKMRKSAARATESPDIPAPVQETIKTSPESFYDPQSMKRVEEVVTAMPEEALSGVPPTSDLYVASKLEQARRRFDAGDNDAGYNVFVELEKQGTSFGQNINQFKRLAGALPEHVAFVIDKKLKAAGKDALTPVQRGRVIEITKRNKQADAALDKATEAWKDNPTPENAKAAETKLDAANESALELQQFTNKFQPRTTWGTLKSILQGNLLTPISEAYNLFGNMSFAPFRALTRGGAASVDIIDSFLRSKPREVAAQPLRGTLEAAKGAVRGIKEIPAILARGTGNAIKGETRSGLHPLRAWADQFAKNPERPTVGGKLGFSERLNLALEGTFGMPAEVMLRGLGAGDAPFRRAAEARVVAEQLKLKGVPKDQWAFAQKFPELFFDRATMEQVRNDAAAAIFQGKSTSLDAINRLIRNNWATQRGVHPDAMDFAFSIVAPYKLTPWKITGEILSYNPLVAMARTALEVKNGNTRAAKLNASKFVVGSVLTGASYWLYQKGLLAPSLDDRDETQKSRILAGEVLPPNHVNISGLKRALEGGDPAFKAGDETVDIFRAGGLAGANMYLVANIGRDFERKPDEAQSGLVGSIIRQSTLESAKFAMNQSYLSGVEGLLTAIKDGSSENYVRQLVNTVGSIPLPNTLGAISRATREYKPDFSAATFDKQVENMVRSRLGFAGLDDYLPLKRGLWGEPLLETPKDKNALFYHFFDISKNKQVTDDPVPLELYRLWRKTGSGKVIPEPVDKAITIQRQTYPLTPAQQSRFAELVGAERRAITEMLVTNPEFQDYEDDGKMRLLERAYQKGLERGKLAFWDEVGESLQPKPVRAGFTP